jgi:dTDP-4-amino-4,6-dideoxygalactose transaminase
VPVLTEVDWSLTIDPSEIKKRISPQTKAILVVHMLNLVCDMDAIMAIAKEHNLLVIEDACQAIGVTYHGRRVGSIGDAGALSFQLNKNIQAGEGGAVLTNSEKAYNRALMYHDVGSYIRPGRVVTEEPLFVGQNYRMPNLSAAILRPQLRTLDAKLKIRRERRKFWLDKLNSKFGSGVKVNPHHDPDNAVAIAVSFEDPEEARRFGSQRGIERLLDTQRHVYTNWESLRSGVTFHPKVDPYAAIQRDVRVKEDSCPRTLDILARTCHIKLMPEIPMAAYRRMVGETSR